MMIANRIIEDYHVHAPVKRGGQRLGAWRRNLVPMGIEGDRRQKTQHSGGHCRGAKDGQMRDDCADHRDQQRPRRDGA
jgi:hypothetical protein